MLLAPRTTRRRWTCGALPSRLVSSANRRRAPMVRAAAVGEMRHPVVCVSLFLLFIDCSSGGESVPSADQHGRSARAPRARGGGDRREYEAHAPRWDFSGMQLKNASFSAAEGKKWANRQMRTGEGLTPPTRPEGREEWRYQCNATNEGGGAQNKRQNRWNVQCLASVPRRK